MRSKKISKCVVLFCMFIYMQGCYSVSYIDPQQLEPHATYDIQKVKTLSGDVYEFVRGARFVDGAIIGNAKEHGLVQISIEDISIVYVRKFNALETCGCTIVCIVISSLALGFIIMPPPGR